MVMVKRGALAAAALFSACDAIHRVPPVQDDQRLLGGRHAANETRTKTMNVKGHTVSEVSASWTGNVVYAIFTSAIPRYHEALLSQLESWAERPAKQGRYVAVGGDNYPDDWQSKNVLRSECGDSMQSISCKEATLLAEGAARGADWLYVIGEDNYVHTGRVEEFLRDKDPEEAIAYGYVGCGRGAFCRDSELFEASGGLCGGSGYIISRAALRLLLAGGAPGLHAVYDNSTWPNDMTTSCQLRRHGVRLETAEDMLGWPVFGIAEYERIARSGFLSAHYLRPDVMRWFHAEVEGAAESVKKQLEDKAFDHGCAVGMRTGPWAREWADCLASGGGRGPSWG
mmetsp:Transcript_5114/g.14489  ORF Transcript_5114/g.14489 Transcript_5114/m.14489 type:complete len:341 (+) Transcript_5114:88-1110(+)